MERFWLKGKKLKIPAQSTDLSDVSLCEICNLCQMIQRLDLFTAYFTCYRRTQEQEKISGLEPHPTPTPNYPFRIMPEPRVILRRPFQLMCMKDNYGTE